MADARRDGGSDVLRPRDPSTPQSADTAAGATPAPDPELADAAVSTAGGLDPAVLAGGAFFGGAFVLSLLSVAWYWRAR